jgi:5-carboxymethyl-2-hydroxymuconate isomerase
MPHIKLEHSTNIKETIDPQVLFSAVHKIIVDTIGADLLRCQSRVFPSNLFYLGEGNSNEAFICLEIWLLEGRPLPKLQEMGIALRKLLEGYFSTSFKELNTQIGVRIGEFPSSHYFKIQSLR